MLKNYAMLGVGRKPNGLVTITDNDLIEKSNLNRQFLFRPHHIQKPKSVVAAQSTVEINPELCIEAQQYKVYPGTEQDVYNDSFFSRQDLVVNALDNVEARRYVDSRCVSNQCPLLESGTMGPKGHVQVIVPHLTESYSSQQDPPDQDVPYCTLKSFPATIEHTIQWARDKFESLFTQKPSMYNKFWSVHTTPRKALEHLSQKFIPDGIVKVTKMLEHRPGDWADCVRLARVKFEKYFNHKVCCTYVDD
jgi:ubiquitin-activating enzyme E1-like protein 2